MLNMVEYFLADIIDYLLSRQFQQIALKISKDELNDNQDKEHDTQGPYSCLASSTLIVLLTTPFIYLSIPTLVR